LRKWDVKAIDETKNQITFVLTSPDLDQGFPGELQMEATYQLSEDNCLSVTYQGKTNQKTIFNPTNHSYFNLNGHDQGKVTRHVLQLNASQYTPVKDSKSIPTGELATVANTPMDFTQPKEIGQEIEADFEQLIYTKGYDHNYALNPNQPIQARLVGDQSGITMEMTTDLPGVQLYTGNFLANHPGKGGITYPFRSGVCLESQYFPNAINEPSFDSPLLAAGEEKVTTTTYRFV
ncbi:MAG: aldose epimerase family protein, partial [Enterococcus lemanii]